MYKTDAVSLLQRVRKRTCRNRPDPLEKQQWERCDLSPKEEKGIHKRLRQTLP